MIGSTAVTMIFGIPLFLIGIPASLIPVYVWVRAKGWEHAIRDGESCRPCGFRFARMRA
jgi:hypothetical protein